MQMVMQPTPAACGQACIAMIADKSIGEVIKDMKTDGPTSIGQLMEALDFYGIRHAERNKRISKKNPVPYKYSILTVHMDAGYTHWTLLHDGKFYDPEYGLIEGDYPHGKITSFLEIYADEKSDQAGGEAEPDGKVPGLPVRHIDAFTVHGGDAAGEDL